MHKATEDTHAKEVGVQQFPGTAGILSNNGGENNVIDLDYPNEYYKTKVIKVHRIFSILEHGNLRAFVILVKFPMNNNVKNVTIM